MLNALVKGAEDDKMQLLERDGELFDGIARVEWTTEPKCDYKVLDQNDLRLL